MIKKIIEWFFKCFNIIKRGDVVTFSESEYEIRTALCNGKGSFQLLDSTPKRLRLCEMKNIRLFKKFFKPEDYAPIKGPWKFKDGFFVNRKSKEKLECGIRVS